MQHRIRPGLNPGSMVLGNIICAQRGGLGWNRGELGKRVRQRNIRCNGIDCHLPRDISLERRAQHEVHEFLREGEMLSPFEDADKFNLMEAGIGSNHCRDRRLGNRR